jgi:cysteine desulfurase
MRVYLDNAASTPIIPEVIDVMLPLMKEQFGNPSSIHAEGRKGRSLIEAARKKIANALNASIGEIFFTSGGTEASNTAIKCSVRDLGVTDIVSSPTEHHCVLHSMAEVQRTKDINVHYLPLDEWGRPQSSALEEKLAELSGKRVLVSLMHANNELGALINLHEIGEICKTHGALFHTDSVQTIGHFPIDVSTTNVHFLTGAAHKFHGPKGVGFMYISNDHIVRPFVDGGSQERNMRGGTENLYGIAGMAEALEQCYANLEAHKATCEELRAHFLKGLQAIEPDLRINTDLKNDNLWTVLSVSFPPTTKAELLLFNLDIAGIAASGGSACSSGADAGSHVIKALHGEDDCMITIRFSFSHMNTKEELDYALAKIEGFLKVKEAC